MKTIARKEELQANDKPNQGIVESILRHLGTALKSALYVLLKQPLSIVSSLPKGLASARKRLSKNGLIGLLGRLARTLSVELRKISANAFTGALSGKQNS